MILFQQDVAPPRGVRGLKFRIEGLTVHDCVAPPRGVRGLKSEGGTYQPNTIVAPPRGVRGLKYCVPVCLLIQLGRTPSWGAWIEIDW